MAKVKIHRDNTVREVDRRNNSKSFSKMKDIYFTEAPKTCNSSSGVQSSSAWPTKPMAQLPSPALQPSPPPRPPLPIPGVPGKSSTQQVVPHTNS